MAYKVIILYQLYMPSYFLGTFTEYPYFIDVILQDDCCAFEALVQKYGESVELSPVLIFSVPEVRSLFFYF